MKENTFTYTARSTEDPEKTATFTLHNGSISVQLGEMMQEQLDSAVKSRDEDTGVDVKEWVKPVAAGAAQRFLQPVPVNDFDAQLDENKLHTTTWLRAGGLRVAPIIITWDEIDNPEAAKAFVDELGQRKTSAQMQEQTFPSILDYWVSWIAAGTSLIILSVVAARLIKQFLAKEREASSRQ